MKTKSFSQNDNLMALANTFSAGNLRSSSITATPVCDVMLCDDVVI